MSALSALQHEDSEAGVYGLRVAGMGPSELFATVAGDAPALEVTVETGRSDNREALSTEDRVETELIDGGWLSVHRSGQAHFTLPARISADELLHPWLVPAAGAMNGWHGRQVVHGGVFSVDGRAIGLLGEKEDGKSSLLAWLSRCPDVAVLADDLVVVDQGDVLSGPRCIDLRPASLRLVDAHDRAQLVRDGSRSRLMLPPCPSSARLVATVVLTWTDVAEVSLTRLGIADALTAILPHTQAIGDRAQLLDLLDVPVWRLERPRSWASLPLVEERLRWVLDATQ